MALADQLLLDIMSVASAHAAFLDASGDDNAAAFAHREARWSALERQVRQLVAEVEGGRGVLAEAGCGASETHAETQDTELLAGCGQSLAPHFLAPQPVRDGNR